MNKNNRLCGSLQAVAIASCMLAASATSSLAAETRAAWGTPSMGTGTPVDDEALMQVTARGTLDENAVKALQTKGKLAELRKQGDGLSQSSLIGGALDGGESTERQAVHTQLKMTVMAAQTIGNTIQATSLANPATAPIPFVPDMTAPLFGLANLGAQIATGTTR